MRLEEISSEQGLSQGMVYDILQDRQGYLWFGTRDGLNQYDGYHFKVYKNDPFNQFSLSDNITKVLVEDHLGRIWIGTENNGVDVFDRVTCKFYHLSKGENGLSDQNVLSMAETSDGVMWVGTQDGLNRVLLPTELPIQSSDLSQVAQTEHFYWEDYTTFPELRCNAFASLMVTDDGTLWVGTLRNVYCLNPQTGKRELLPIQEVGGLKDNQRASFFTKGLDGSVWIGQLNRIVHIKDGRISFITLPLSSQVYFAALTFDTDGNLFVNKRKEIFFYPAGELADFENGKSGGRMPEPQTFFRFPEKDVIGSSKIVSDRGGLIWIGTNGYGIRKYNPVNRLFRHYLPGVSTRKICSNEKGELWVWTSSGQFSLLEEKGSNQGKPIIQEKNLFQHDCLYSHDGNTFWMLGQYRSGADDNSILIRKNLKTGTEERMAGLISAGLYSQIMEDRIGNIWLLGNKSDLVKYDPVRKTAQKFDLSAYTSFKEYAFAIMEDVKGYIWVGTPHGLIRGVPNEKNDSFHLSLFRNNPDNRQSLNNNVIMCVLDDSRDPEQFLWIGTRGGGLNLMNKITGDCQHFTPADGLPNDVVYGILSDGNESLWLSTNSGLSKFNVTTRHFENYSAADGLQDNEFNTTSYAKTKDGRMVFGGVNGLTIFDPELIKDFNETPPLQITGLRVHGNVVIPGDGILEHMIEQTRSITLPYYQNQITLEFSAMDFSTPQKNQFRFRLLGERNNWSEATNDHSVTFSNLSPGKYTFEVLTGGAHGVWNGDPVRLEITILSPWWKSNLAWLLYLLLALVLSWQAYRFQVRRIQLKEQLAFEHRETERIRAVEQMKTDFFHNITHELRTPVTLILEPLRQILNDPSAENWLSKVRLAEGNSQKLLGIVNQLLDLAKLEVRAMQPAYQLGHVDVLLESVVEAFSEKAKNKNITLRYVPADTPVAPFEFDADKLGKIVNNLLSNALKFTPEGGNVDVSWRADPSGWFELTVKDTGHGIAASDLPRIFDRFFSKVANPEHMQSSTGIGLALCRELAELMGGKMEVESVEGKGSTFRLRLLIKYPTRQKIEGQSERQVSAPFDVLPEEGRPSYPIVESLATKNERPQLLLVEDNQELRHFIAQTLAGKFDVTEAVDGQEAIEIALERVPDIIVSDLMMPRLDGLGLLGVLKNDVRTSHIPILMLTAKTDLEDRIEGIQQGADAYLGKPFQTGELLAWLQNLLEGRRRLQERLWSKGGAVAGAIAVSAEQHSAGPSSPENSLGLIDRQFLEQFQTILEAEIDNERITPTEIAHQLAISRSQLHRKLSALTGLSATEYLRNFRLDRALELLRDGAGNVSEIAWRVGFVNPKHFSTSFKERFGKSPSEV